MVFFASRVIWLWLKITAYDQYEDCYHVHRMIVKRMILTRPYTRAEVACGWAGAVKSNYPHIKLSVTDRLTDGPTDGQSGL